ncbi:hypothetical protein WICPIJ_003806 [Wickerhamomyces pijperi]|uniref:J domain-containing protein n=1 Tax=Wickerhamomyces pijperi TaxID=599730 RepID=A0A9P8Q8Y3_WICPI|nr:hypothetical protein WICPIJ_003806 [Wickerhamomyces pijperi]
MNSKYSYDEHSTTWPVFALALLSVATVPLTIQTLVTVFSSSKPTTGTSDGVSYDDDKHAPEPVKKYRKKTQKSHIFNKKGFFLLLAWLAIGFFSFKIYSTEAPSDVSSGVFDPYELLEIGFGTSEKEIKSHYKKLTIKYHPDKIRNKSEEEKKELEERFVLITKAYKALTDETTRENFEKYGHPDGPQETSHGIALPKALIEGALSPVLLAIYITLIGLVLPYLVNSWWTKTKSYTKKGVHNETATMFLENMLNFKPSEIVTVDTILQWLSEAKEFELIKPSSTSDDILQVFRAYLSRSNAKLSDSDYEVIALVPTLINALVDISATFRNTDITNTAFETLKSFSQALLPSIKNELLQLPNVDPAAVAKSPIVRLSKLMKLPKEEIKKVLGITSDAKLQETLDVASTIPIMNLVKSEFKVTGEKVVTPQSNAHISVKVIVKTGAQKNSDFRGKIAPEDMEEPDSFEYLKDPFKIVSEQPELPTAYTPYFPAQRQAKYVAFIVVQKDGKITDSPVFFHNLDLSNLLLTEEELKLESTDAKVGTFKIPFAQPTPTEPGKYQFRVIIKSLDYFTPDLDFPLVMTVEEPPRVEEISYDIPEAEEGSLADTMAQLKAGKLTEIDEEEEGDDDESDLEEEDWSDINTDTEDEDA